MRTWQDSKQQTLSWCRRRRQELIDLLGAKCEHCGEDDPAKLEFHHTAPRTWVASKLNRWSRLARYTEDIEKGVVSLLCSTCNKRAGQPVSEDEQATGGVCVVCGFDMDGEGDVCEECN